MNTRRIAQSMMISGITLHDKYVAHPKTTFTKIETEIMPEMYAKLSDAVYDKVMDAKAEIVARLADDGYNDDPLTETYLLGYYLQRGSIQAR
jgi:hypothetical protein